MAKLSANCIIRQDFETKAQRRRRKCNSMCYALGGKVIEMEFRAGEQSRINCSRLAGEKADNWWLRRRPRVATENFVNGTLTKAGHYLEIANCECSHFNIILTYLIEGKACRCLIASEIC